MACQLGRGKTRVVCLAALAPSRARGCVNSSTMMWMESLYPHRNEFLGRSCDIYMTDYFKANGFLRLRLVYKLLRYNSEVCRPARKSCWRCWMVWWTPMPAPRSMCWTSCQTGCRCPLCFSKRGAGHVPAPVSGRVLCMCVSHSWVHAGTMSGEERWPISR